MSAAEGVTLQELIDRGATRSEMYSLVEALFRRGKVSAKVRDGLLADADAAVAARRPRPGVRYARLTGPTGARVLICSRPGEHKGHWVSEVRWCCGLGDEGCVKARHPNVRHQRTRRAS